MSAKPDDSGLAGGGSETTERERFTFLLDGIDVGVWYCDLPFDVLQWDERTKRHFGLESDAVVDIKLFYDVILPEDREPTEQAIATSVSSKSSYDTVYRTLGPDGKLRWIRALGRTSYAADGSPIRFDGITMDVSRQYLLEQEMLRGEQRYRLLVEATSAIVWESDGESRFVRPQRTWEQYTGQSWEAHQGAGWRTAVHPADLEALETAFSKAVQDRRVLQSGGRLWHEQTQAYRFFEIKAVPMLGREGRISEWIGTIFDVQERRESELAAVHASRMKSAFLANMSHELRTPMAGVQGMVDLLFDTPLEPLQAEYAQAIKNCSQSLTSLLDDILDLSRIEAGKLLLKNRAYELRPVIASTLALFGLQAEERNLQLRVGIDSRVPAWLYGDPDRIRQILVNLVSNSMKFTPSGFVELRVFVSEQTLAISVQDSGIGISEENLANLFQPFVQIDSSTARKYEGTGLGLSIVARLVEIMGGTVGVESELGQGSTFLVQVPFQAADPEPEPRQARAESPAVSGRILLVEDNPINRRVVTAQLEKLGHAVEATDGGEEALTALEDSSFDAILMDCQMPGIDGYETTRRLRARGIATPVIALTAHAMEGERDRCLSAGMDDYLTKPLSLADLQRTLQRWLQSAK